jgi:polyhydroxybutyrate depolymerase
MSKRAVEFGSLMTAVALVCGAIVTGPLFGLGAGATSTSTPHSGCGVSVARTTTLSLNVDGFQRTVIVHTPNPQESTPTPLVLNLHGSASTALEQEEFTDMNASANQDDFVVAYPQALIPDGTGFDWNIPNTSLIGGRPVPANAANDVKFLTKLVGILEWKYCIDPHRVYATGFSGGSREVSELACVDSTLFAAIAPVSGLRRPTPCPTRRSVPVISFHGSSDPVDPFLGDGQKYWTYSVPTAARYWSAQDHCTTKTTSHLKNDVILSTYANCTGGAKVELYEIIGEGHEWPGGPTLPSGLTSILGPQSSAINANSTMWSFFSRYHL